MATRDFQRRMIRRSAARLLIASTVSVVALGAATSPAVAQGSAGPADMPIDGVTGSKALLFIGIGALVVALLWFVPLMYDIRQANRWRRDEQTKILNRLIDAAQGLGPENSSAPPESGGSGVRSDNAKDVTVQRISVEEVRQLVSAMDSPPRGASGLTSSLLALLVVTLVGLAMVATLLSEGTDSSDLRKTIITSLLSILATIAGFYFGAKTAQSSTEQANRPPESRHEPRIDPSSDGGAGGRPHLPGRGGRRSLRAPRRRTPVPPRRRPRPDEP